MKAQKICPTCGAISYENIEEKIKFFYNGVIVEVTVMRINDVFYEIIKGKYMGNLVHVFDLIK